MSEAFYFVVALQVLSGMGWACFEVGLALMFFQDLRQDEKVPVLTIYNLLNSVAIIVGTFLGAKFLSLLGEVKNSYWISFVVGSALRIIFCIPVSCNPVVGKRSQIKKLPLFPKHFKNSK